jgi:hypothetical protein
MVASEGFPAIRLHTQGADFFDKTYFLKRGDLKQKQDEATQSFLQVLMRTDEGEKHWQAPPPANWRTSYRRRALANWLTDADQGAGNLLARVIVNRLWQHHFGRGIVATPSDFGAQGERPTHPELLDWLASELVARSWSLKEIHRLILTSAVYTQNADYDTARAAIDPGNVYQWRWTRRRLEGEAIRDSLRASSGTLERRMFGPGSLDEAQPRRSVYFTVKRSQLNPFMMLFDAPDSLQSMGNRASTTIAPQALAMLNSPQVRAAATALAARIGTETASRPSSAAIERAYVAIIGRPPTAEELRDATAFHDEQAHASRQAGDAYGNVAALVDLCQALYCLNEFLFVE